MSFEQISIDNYYNMETDKDGYWHGIFKRYDEKGSVLSLTPYTNGYIHGISIKRVRTSEIPPYIKNVLNISFRENWIVTTMETYNNGYLIKLDKTSWESTKNMCKIQRKMGMQYRSEDKFMVVIYEWTNTNPIWRMIDTTDISKSGIISSKPLFHTPTPMTPIQTPMTPVQTLKFWPPDIEEQKTSRKSVNEFKSVIKANIGGEERAIYFNSLDDPSFRVQSPTRLIVTDCGRDYSTRSLLEVKDG